jgi:hypothetical protein
MRQDEQHLQALSICYYILGGLLGLLACFPVVYLALGIAMVSGQIPPPSRGVGPPPELGWIFIGVASVLILLGWLMAAGLFFTGYMLGRRRGYVFCLVMAGAASLFQPLGLVLAIFTFIVLMRPRVKKLFGQPLPVRDEDPDEDY